MDSPEPQEDARRVEREKPKSLLRVARGSEAAQSAGGSREATSAQSPDASGGRSDAARGSKARRQTRPRWWRQAERHREGLPPQPEGTSGCALVAPRSIGARKTRDCLRVGQGVREGRRRVDQGPLRCHEDKSRSVVILVLDSSPSLARQELRTIHSWRRRVWASEARGRSESRDRSISAAAQAARDCATRAK